MSQHILIDGPHPTAELLRRALQAAPQFFGKDVRVGMAEDGIVLSGEVRSYYHKQMAQESLRGLAGAARIRNRLAVRRGGR